MITQENVLELYDRANPVSDVENLKTDIGAASYLASLEQRSSEVTQLETRPEQQQKSRSSRLVAIAAVLLIILGTAVVVMTRSTEEAPIATDPSPVTTVVPTTAPELDPGELQAFTGNEPAGTYRPAIFQPVFAFTLGRDGWRPDYGTGRHFGLTPPENQEDFEQPMVFFTAPDTSTVSGAETVEEVVSYLSSHPGLGLVTVSSTKLAGADAQLITAVGTASSVPLWGNKQNTFYGTGQGHDFTFYIFEVAGAPVVVTLNYQNASERNALGAEVEAIVDSIRWAAAG